MLFMFKNFFKKIKGSKLTAVLSIVMIVSSIVSIICGYYVVSSVVNLILWILVLICSIKGW